MLRVESKEFLNNSMEGGNSTTCSFFAGMTIPLRCPSSVITTVIMAHLYLILVFQATTAHCARLASSRSLTLTWTRWRRLTTQTRAQLQRVMTQWWSKQIMEKSSPSTSTWDLVCGKTQNPSSLLRHPRSQVLHRRLQRLNLFGTIVPFPWRCIKPARSLMTSHMASMDMQGTIKENLFLFQNHNAIWHNTFRMPERNFEVGNAGANVPGCLGHLAEPFEKEDMSEMFRRAFLEKMSVDEPDRPNYKCFVCSQLISGRTITAMTHKFHPECFVCTYCRKEFKDRTFKTDPIDNNPYCKACFEKLLGHFGNAHGGFQVWNQWDHTDHEFLTRKKQRKNHSAWNIS